MNERILFFGTSFLGAVQDAWREKFPDNPSSFVGIRGPQLAHNLNECWRVEGSTLEFGGGDTRFYCRNVDDAETHPKDRLGRDSFAGLALAFAARVDLQSYDSFFFVDLFFRPIHEITMDADGWLFLDRLPTTRKMLLSGQVDGIRGSKLDASPGERKIRTIVPFLQAVRQAVPDKPVRLLGKARPFDIPKSLPGRYPDIETARRSLALVDDLNEDVLRQLDIEPVKQPASILDDHAVLTRKEFSIGPHKMGPELYDPHMTAAYGHAVLESIGYR